MTRSRSAALLLIGTFVMGALIGGALTAMADHRAHKRPGYVERLAADLDLTPAQRDSVQAVLERHQPAMDSLWQLFRPQLQSERQLIRNDISALLSESQRAKYRELQRQDSLRRAEQDSMRRAADRSRNGRS